MHLTDSVTVEVMGGYITVNGSPITVTMSFGYAHPSVGKEMLQRLQHFFQYSIKRHTRVLMNNKKNCMIYKCLPNRMLFAIPQ